MNKEKNNSTLRATRANRWVQVNRIRPRKRNDCYLLTSSRAKEKKWHSHSTGSWTGVQEQSDGPSPWLDTNAQGRSGEFQGWDSLVLARGIQEGVDLRHSKHSLTILLKYISFHIQSVTLLIIKLTLTFTYNHFFQFCSEIIKTFTCFFYIRVLLLPEKCVFSYININAHFHYIWYNTNLHYFIF